MVNHARACMRSAANCSAPRSLIDAATEPTPARIARIACRTGSSGQSGRSARLQKVSAPWAASGSRHSAVARSANSAASAGFSVCACGSDTTPNGVANSGTTCGAGMSISNPPGHQGQRSRILPMAFI